MLVDPADKVLLLPAKTRYEQAGGGTETSTERRVYFSPEIPGRRIREARTEWEIFMSLAQWVMPHATHLTAFKDAAAIRAEIAKPIPTYDGIQHLRSKGDAFQYGGPRLCEDGSFPMPDGRAVFTELALPAPDIPAGLVLLGTRPGETVYSIAHSAFAPYLGRRHRHRL